MISPLLHTIASKNITRVVIVFGAVFMLGSSPQLRAEDSAAAELDAAGGETDSLAAGMKIFLNRPYTARQLPDDLTGCRFIRNNLEKSRAVCRQPGLVYVLTPPPERNPDSLQKNLLERGFVRVNRPEFVLHGVDFVVMFQKQMASDEVLELGKWGVVVLPCKAAAPAPAPAPLSPGVVTSEFIYESAPFPSCHASTIAETKNGLVAAWFGGTKEGHPDVCIWSARQIGGHWSAPEKVASQTTAEGKPTACFNPVLFQPKPGTLLLFYKSSGGPQGWSGFLKTSTDDGATWSDAKRLPEGFVGPVKNKPVRLPDGSLLCGSSLESGEKPSKWRVQFERTDDLGQKWTKTDFLNDGWDIAAIQPSILFHPGGKLQALGRTRQGKIFETWSGDGGKTWSAITLTDLPNPNSGTDAVTLRDGRHLLVYNHTDKGRSPLNVAISADGKRWQSAAVLETEPQKEFSYPAVIQTGDGLVHITYTWKRQRIKHVVLDPARLKLTP